jgi:D-lactate dehydrogenase
MKIAYVTPQPDEEELVREVLAGREVVFYGDALGETDGVPAELRDAEVLSIFVNSRLTPAMIDSMPNLKHIALRSTGFDHVAVAHAEEKGIVVSYVPHYGSQTVAEHTFALILTLSRKINAMYDLMRTSGEVSVPEHEGFDLCGKTIGIVGTGAIGKRVCEIAKGFRMNVVAFDLYPDETFAIEHGMTYLSLNELLATADITTFHVPATKENYHLLNEDNLTRVKPGAYIINTARGTLIDTVALIHALKSGKLSGAGLDVYEGEEYLKDELKLVDAREELNVNIWKAFAAEHELLDMPNVVMTPHMAFNTKEAKREIIDTTVANIKHWSEGGEFFRVKMPV